MILTKTSIKTEKSSSSQEWLISLSPNLIFRRTPFYFVTYCPFCNLIGLQYALQREQLDVLTYCIRPDPLRASKRVWLRETRLVATSHRLASCVIVSRFRTALDLDTYPLSNIRPRCAERAKRSRGKPVLIMHIGFLACFHAISLERSRFSKIACLLFRTLVALKMLVSLVSRLVACSPRKSWTNRQTHTQNDYCNPRCGMSAEG